MTPVELLKSLSGPAALGGAPFGADLMAFIPALEARGGIGVYVVRDDKTAATARRLAEFISPRLDQVDLPGWDTLPYDRVSPTASVAARRCAALARLSRYEPEQGPLLVVTTATSIVQRVPPIETMRRASFSMISGQAVSQKELNDYLLVNGYVRASTVREQGEYAIRGGIIDIFPPTAGEPLRLDFFGDTLETIRTFDTETQRSTGETRSVAFAPVSEILFDDDVLSRFREKYLDVFGPPSGDPMYEAARASIRRQGVEAWLPLFHDSLDTLFDYIGNEALIGFGHLSGEAAAERLSQAADYYQARLEAGAGDARAAKVLAPEQLYLDPAELEQALAAHPVARFSPAEPAPGHYDMEVRRGRDFAPERMMSQENIFEATIAHTKDLRKSGRHVVFAAWSTGSADRLINVLADHGLNDLVQVHSLEAARKAEASVVEIPLETGFVSKDLAVISEADILGDRLAAPRRKRKTANFITDAATLNAGDLVVHVDHGVGRYVGLKTVEVIGAPHDCLNCNMPAGTSCILPVENIELCPRYGSEDQEAQLDKLGGGAGRRARPSSRSVFWKWPTN
jgi:transcription-repair coupling factor (superfamily II helicase)